MRRSLPVLLRPGVWITCLAVLPPLAWLVVAGIGALLRYGPVFPDAIAARVLGRTIQLGLVTTVLSVALGGSYGWLVARYRLPGRTALLWASILPALLPAYAGALAWTILLARDGAVNETLLRWGWLTAPVTTYRSFPIAAWVLVSAYWPVAAWFTLAAARSVPRDLEDAARLHLPDGVAARWCALPALARALAAAALLVLLLAMAEFLTPNLLALPMYPVEIVNRFQLDRDAGMTVRLALPVLLLVTPLVWSQTRGLENALPAASEPPRLLPPSWFGAAGCWLLLAITFALPLGVLAAASLPLHTYVMVWEESADHLGNTLITAGLGALLSVALALLLGWATRPRPPRLLDLMLTLPYALPASLLGIAMIQILNQPGPPEWLYTSLGGLVWMYVALFFPFAHKSVQTTWAHVDPELLDEGALLGAGAWAQFWSAVWPVARPRAVIGGLLVALLAAREVDATGLLRIPGGDTISFRIQDYLHFAPGPNVAALCVLLVILSAAVTAGVCAWALRE